MQNHSLFFRFFFLFISGVFFFLSVKKTPEIKHTSDKQIEKDGDSKNSRTTRANNGSWTRVFRVTVWHFNLLSYIRQLKHGKGSKPLQCDSWLCQGVHLFCHRLSLYLEKNKTDLPLPGPADSHSMLLRVSRSHRTYVLCSRNHIHVFKLRGGFGSSLKEA